MPGATLTFYASGTSTPLTVYSDANHSVPYLVDPVADQAGRFPPIFLQTAEYKVVWKDANGDEVDTFDPVAPFLDDDPALTSFYDLWWFTNQKTTNGEICFIYNTPRELKLVANLINSIFSVDSSALPTGTTTFTLYRNTSNIGTISFSTAGAVTVVFLSDVTFNAGDQFKMVGPMTADATANFMAFTFVFTVV
jgi:hypothetical protein